MQEQSLMLHGEQGHLEAKLYLPEYLSENRIQDVALVLHPHPLHGGTMTNKVVTTLVKAFIESHSAALTFNFAGVGSSEGVHQHGVGEIKDALRAVRVLEERFPHTSITVAGFSFGAYVAYSSAFLFPFKRIVLIAPPATYPEMNKTHLNLPPCLVVQGEVDEVIASDAVYEWVIHHAPSSRVMKFPGAGHFFHGKLSELKQAVAQFLME